MSCYKTVCSSLLVALASLCLSTHALAEPPTASTSIVRIATGDWQPYVDSSKPDFGPLGHVIKTVFERAGYSVEFNVYPWTRNAQFVATGDQDAMMPYYCSEARSLRYLCSTPIVDGEQVFFHRRGLDFSWDDMTDLKPFTIGATLGYFYGQSFEMAEQSGRISVKRIAEDRGNLKLLMHGRIDLYPQDRAVGYGMVRAVLPRNQWREITHHPRPLHSKALHLLFSRATGRGEELLQVFDRELTSMRESGELEELLRPIYADQRAVRGEGGASGAME
ncbi:transporter substrate-binding domain-containing protein [Marinobacter nanhaiticus D15-8W]|uniref:Amino acid ABC transporter substrate-binding protein n=1 Tax=Marinobacter nanhaiticus D15-8W TaxID=626887 RepID=N6WXF7_9GAMM|nr:transporter substrate-binding domain-containing protein [Marinobacter nanhaiticus]ENO15727.1 amino acid ABC transporter substrate-binding protein [Marinobacter nanhaiticus D15-8W]BES73416.1 transporter substrate-binding domain-containing protein [Marinobacter nanhaiticus D15-8W]